MSQEDISELTKAIREMRDNFHAFQLKLAECNARTAKEIEALQKSDMAQWNIIRDTQDRMMKIIYLLSGAAAVLAFLDIGGRVRDLLVP